MGVLWCKKPDRDASWLLCFHPLPCPYHTVVIEPAKREVMPFTKKKVKKHLDNGEALK